MVPKSRGRSGQSKHKKYLDPQTDIAGEERLHIVP